MNLGLTSILLLQSPFPFDFGTEYLGALTTLLNLFYALAVNGYLILVLVGFIVFATGLSDGTAKGLVIFGVFLFFVGPMITNYFASMAGLGVLTIESATSTFYGLFGMYESQVVALIVLIGDGVMAVCILVGAILYFNPTSGDLKARGHSLIVRGVMLAPVLAFMHVVPFL
ncbi:MAG: hypothetical protein ACFFED_01670 [Candidatus Thorarchaeota archaeon]